MLEKLLCATIRRAKNEGIIQGYRIEDNRLMLIVYVPDKYSNLLDCFKKVMEGDKNAKKK